MGGLQQLHFVLIYERTEEKYVVQESWTSLAQLFNTLAQLFNASLRSGVMLTLLKSANVTPVHKGDKIELVENYRPISLLPIPAKCLERIVDDAVCGHIFPYLH